MLKKGKEHDQSTMSTNEEFALDAVDSNPRPATPHALDIGRSPVHRNNAHVIAGQTKSPRSAAATPFFLQPRIGIPAFSPEDEACITETPHFNNKRLHAPQQEVPTTTTAATNTDEGFISEKWSKRSSPPRLHPLPTDDAATVPLEQSHIEDHKQILFRQLLAELHAERSARIKLEVEVKQLRKALPQREQQEVASALESVPEPDVEQRDQAAADSSNKPLGTTTTSPTTSLIKQPVPFRTIPIVDLSLPLADTAFEVGQACRQVGFFYIVNHGMDPAIVSNTMTYSKRFFDLPASVKSEVDSSKSRSGARGYFALGGEDLNAKDGTRDLVAEGQSIGGGGESDEAAASAPAFQGDWKEGYDCGREVSPNDAEYAISTMIDGNYWPRDEVLPGFREAMLDYQRGVRQIGDTLMEAFAVGLGLPSNFFVEKTQKPMATLRLLHYPPQPKQDMSTLDRIGCGAHTDYGLCTLLLQDEVGGLQVRNSADEWVNAPYIEGSFVVNIGDMMSMWSNGRYASTVHRVVNMTGKERYSIPFFLNPDVGTMVGSLSTCQRKDEVSRRSEASHDVLSKRYHGSFVHLKDSEEQQ